MGSQAHSRDIKNYLVKHRIGHVGVDHRFLKTKSLDGLSMALYATSGAITSSI
jgi:hypothetical protein